MIDPKVKAEWVKRLRSGEINQGFNALAYYNGNDELCYCALGVAYKLLHPTWTTFHYSSLGIGSTAEACTELHINIPEQSRIVQMNDTERQPFSVIADWIEANL